MLTQDIIQQVKQVFDGLQSDYTLLVHASRDSKDGMLMHEFTEDVASTSPRLTKTEDGRNELSFELLRGSEPTGIIFRGIPNGHEFTSLLLAVLNADGKGKNLPDERIAERISLLKGPIHLQTYMSLTCTNCPDVVQALNVLTLLRSDVEHKIIDGALYQQEVSERNIQAVPTVYANGALLHVGRGNLGELLQELEERIGSNPSPDTAPKVLHYDVVIAGGGPAGVSAAIYSARKAQKVAIVAGRIGGQVNDTTGIENLISVPTTTGGQLSADLRSHMQEYDIDIYENRKIESISNADDALKHVNVHGGETFAAPAVIITTGASWRKLGVEGENEYLGHGVHFCPHCDGPFYKGRRVAVIGGGNSGIEAAIDLAALASHVTVVEFAPQLRADDVLLSKVSSLSNVDIITSRQTIAVNGDGTKMQSITIKDLLTEETSDLSVDGVFVQIGLSPNSEFVDGLVKLNSRREIEVDSRNHTSVKGIYAAGDVTDIAFKQIVISMGDGAKAALSAHDDRIKNII